MRSLLASKKRTNLLGQGNTGNLLPSGATAVIAFEGNVNAYGGSPAGTFSRTTNAWNPETGVVAPQNLLTYSQAFDTAWWNKLASTITADATVAPDGTSTADLLTCDGTAATYRVYRSISLSGSYKTSIYVKSGTARYFQIYSNASATAVNFDIINGSITYEANSGYTNASIVSVGSGWYRVSLSLSNVDTLLYLHVVNGATDVRALSTTTSATLYIWGAQLELGSTVTNYIPTTSSAVYAPRYVVGKRGQGLFLERAATNSFLNSATPVTQNISVTTANSGKWVCSVIGAGAVTSSAGTATATGYGAATAGSPNTITVTGNGTVTYTVSGADATTKVQVENNPYATSYIPTTSATTTRSAESDSYATSGIISTSGSTITGWWKPEGEATGTVQTIWSSYTDASNYTALQYTHGTGVQAVKKVGGTTTLVTSTYDAAPNVWAHYALLIKADNTLDLYVNGAQAGTNTTTTTGTPVIASTMQIGSINGGSQADGTLDQFYFYNRVLTATEIARLGR